VLAAKNSQRVEEPEPNGLPGNRDTNRMDNIADFNSVCLDERVSRFFQLLRHEPFDARQ
jgi:hypothetical protein